MNREIRRHPNNIVTPKQTGSACANTHCQRRVYSRTSDRLGLCHRCMEVALVFQWLIDTGVIKVNEAAASELGIWLPGDKR